jgi:flagellar biosynthetic protein FliP
MNRWFIFLLIGLFSSEALSATTSLQAFSVTPDAQGGQNYSLNIQVLLFMTMLTLLPALLMTMTSFTRIIIVFAILRQAIGLNHTPTNQILIGISLFLSIFIMSPIIEKVNEDALQPYLNDKITSTQALQLAEKPFRSFMLSQTRENDLALFVKLSKKTELKNTEQIPFYVLMPAFLTSELKTAFQIGFILFLPFVIIDLVVASVLMAMGMMMLSPLIISLPFKIMLFVLVDGWTLLVSSLAGSFGV